MTTPSTTTPAEPTAIPPSDAPARAQLVWSSRGTPVGVTRR